MIYILFLVCATDYWSEMKNDSRKKYINTARIEDVIYAVS